MPVEVASGGARAHTGKQRRPRRLARRRGAVGVGERDAHLREAVDIRRAGLRVPPGITDPVVQIVDRDEQHGGLARFGNRGVIAPGAQRRGTQPQNSLHELSPFHHISLGKIAEALFPVADPNDVFIEGRADQGIYQALVGAGHDGLSLHRQRQVQAIVNCSPSP